MCKDTPATAPSDALASGIAMRHQIRGPAEAVEPRRLLELQGAGVTKYCLMMNVASTLGAPKVGHEQQRPVRVLHEPQLG